MAHTKPEIEVEFIRIFFPDRVEEEIAHRWASRLRLVVGSRTNNLRPDTTLAQMLQWGAECRAGSMDFLVVFEPELRMDLAGFLDNSELVTFREMVQHYAALYRQPAQNQPFYRSQC